MADIQPIEPSWARRDAASQGLREGLMLGDAFISAAQTSQKMRQSAAEFPLKLKALDLDNQYAERTLPLKLRQLEISSEIKETNAAIQHNVLNQQLEQARIRQQNTAALTDAYSIDREISGAGAWDQPEARERIDEFLIKHPDFVNHPLWKTWNDRIDNATKVKAAREMRELQTQAQLFGQITSAGIRAQASAAAAKVREAGSEKAAWLRLRGTMLSGLNRQETEAQRALDEANYALGKTKTSAALPDKKLSATAKTRLPIDEARVQAAQARLDAIKASKTEIMQAAEPADTQTNAAPTVIEVQRAPDGSFVIPSTQTTQDQELLDEE